MGLGFFRFALHACLQSCRRQMFLDDKNHRAGFTAAAKSGIICRRHDLAPSVIASIQQQRKINAVGYSRFYTRWRKTGTGPLQTLLVKHSSRSSVATRLVLRSLTSFIIFCVSHSRGEMYIGHAHLCVCLSV